MGEDKSRKQTEQAAMTEAKKKAVESVSTHIRSETEVKNFAFEKDLVSAFANAEVKVLQEMDKGWYKDAALGDCYRVKIRAEVVPDAKFFDRSAGTPGVKPERAELDKLGIEYRVERFLKAVSDNNVNVAELFIKAGIDVNAKTEQEADTALLLAIRNKNEKLAKMVLDAGANPNSQNKAGEYPLHAASDAGLCTVVKQLIAAKADVTGGGARSLAAAASSGFIECARALVEAGAPLNNDDAAIAAGLAAGRGHVDMVKLFVEKGMDVRRSDARGRRLIDTLFFDAVYSGKIEMMQFLLSNGGDKNCRNGGNDTPLMRAIQKNRDEAVQFLIKTGADLNAANRRGETALMLAAEKNRIATIQLLMNAKADPSVADQLGNTPIMEAARSRRVEAVQLLVKPGTGINAVNNKGETALMLAVSGKNIEVMNALLKAGADPSIPGKEGNTPFMRAVHENWDEGVQLLARGGANMNAVDKKGETALIHAVRKNARDMVKVLLEAKVDPDLPDRDGMTPLMWVVRSSYGGESLLLLIKYGANVNAANKEGKTAVLMAVEMNRREDAKVLVEASADVTIADKWGKTALGHATSHKWDSMIEVLQKK